MHDHTRNEPRLCPDLILAVLETCDDLPAHRLATLAALCGLATSYVTESRVLLYRDVAIDLSHTAQAPRVLLTLDTHPHLRPFVKSISIKFSRPPGLTSHAWMWQPPHKKVVERVLPSLVNVRHIALSCDAKSTKEDGGLLNWMAGLLPPRIEHVDVTQLAEWSIRHVLQRIKARDPPVSVRLTSGQYQRAEWVCALLNGKLLEEEYADVVFEAVETREDEHCYKPAAVL